MSSRLPHDGARAGSRTLNLGIKSLHSQRVSECQRVSGTLSSVRQNDAAVSVSVTECQRMSGSRCQIRCQIRGGQVRRSAPAFRWRIPPRAIWRLRRGPTPRPGLRGSPSRGRRYRLSYRRGLGRRLRARSPVSEFAHGFPSIQCLTPSGRCDLVFKLQTDRPGSSGASNRSTDEHD